jgi:hypothetical protein
MGKYKNFEDCITDQQSKGHNLDSSKKICGEIEKRIKQGETKKDWHKLSFNVPIQEFITSENNSDFKIRGIAINETTTRNGTTYLAEELAPAAESFRDKPILKDHKNSVDSIIGRTTENVNYDNVLRAIVFEGRVVDQKMQEMIKNKLIKNVSIGAMVREIEERTMNEGEQSYTQLVARGIEGVEISLVAVPADRDACFAQAMMESFELKKEEELEITPHLEEEKMTEPVKSFGTEEEYKEFLAIKEKQKEDALRLKIETELREKMKKEEEVKVTEKPKDETIGQVTEGTNDTNLKLFENVAFGKDEYSQGLFITRN